MAKRIIVIGGPTAGGKSAMALSLAEILRERNKNPVIINADSQQIYQELRILTARPTAEEEARVPHRLYGSLPAHTRCSAGQWLKLARMEIDWVLAEGGLPIVVGGTGLYLKALMQGIAEMPDIPDLVRQQATGDYEQMGKAAFIERLRAVDPLFLDRLRVHDRQRLIRAYEIWLGSGKPLSWWQQQEVQPAYPAEIFRLFQVTLPRELLYARCNTRFIHMVEHGALDEVRDLLALGLPNDLPIMKSVGVQEFAAYLRRESDLGTAIAQAQQATRNYAKRQLTWFRHQFPEAIPLEAAGLEQFNLGFLG